MSTPDAPGLPRVRPAVLADAAQLARLSAQLGYPERLDVFTARLQRVLSLPEHALFVATDGDDVLGFIAGERRLMIETGERVEIVALVVDERARRRGIGHVLLGAVEQWARDIGLPDLVVRSNVARSQSHPFYEGAGFERVKTQHVYRKRL